MRRATTRHTAALAREQDLDLVRCLGDYIYERHYYPGPAARVDHTGVNGGPTLG